MVLILSTSLYTIDLLNYLLKLIKTSGHGIQYPSPIYFTNFPLPYSTSLFYHHHHHHYFLNFSSKNKCDLSHTVPKNLVLVLQLKDTATVSLEQNIQKFAQRKCCQRFWLFTCSTLGCQIHDISPPNLVGGHDYPFHGRNGNILLSSSFSLHMLGNIPCFCQFWIVILKGSWGETF